jgi:hypothetical protein
VAYLRALVPEPALPVEPDAGAPQARQLFVAEDQAFGEWS